MKKIVLLLVFIFVTTISFSQEAQKTFDPKLVGCWKGSEIEQQEQGLSKYWISCRFEDGKSALLFIAIYKNGKVKQHTENGKWWVENGKYYELHNIDGKTDIYDYEVIDARSVKFTGVDVLGDKNTKYTFYDTKIEDN